MNQDREDRPLVSEPRYGSEHSPFLTADEAVQYLRLSSRKALYRAIERARIPYRRRGRFYLFLRSELDRWLLDNTHGRTGETSTTRRLRMARTR